MKRIKVKALLVAIIAALSIALMPNTAQAASSAGGYSVPSSVSIGVGSTVTIQVKEPSNRRSTVTFTYPGSFLSYSNYQNGSYYGRAGKCTFRGKKAGSGTITVKIKSYKRVLRRVNWRYKWVWVKTNTYNLTTSISVHNYLKDTTTPVVFKDTKPKAEPAPVPPQALDRSKTLATGLGGSTFYLKTQLGEYFLDMDNAYKYNAGNAQIYQLNYTDAQKWTFTRVGNGIYTIKCACSGKVLSVAGNSEATGAQVWQWDYAGSNFQKWYAYRVGTQNGCGVYEFVNVGSGKTLDVKGGVARNCTKMQQWTSANVPAQRWTLWH